MIKLRQQKSLVKQIEKVFDEEEKLALTPEIKEAFLAIDRELFVPNQWRHLAYSLRAVQLKDGQYISSVITVAKMMVHLELNGADSVLEVGCGSGYQAALLSQVCRRVFTIERIDSLLKEARNAFSTHNLNNIFTRFDDGQRGWKAYAPFDRILFSATAKKIPDVLFDQLAEGGILVAPIEQEEGHQLITRYTKKKGGILESESIGSCGFVPILDGTQKQPRGSGLTDATPIARF